MMLLSLVGGAFAAPAAQPSAAPDAVTITVLHTNDFHGNLELAGSNPGIARTAKVINDVRAQVGADNVALLDAGDVMQGSLLSNLFKGKPTIDLFNFMGYKASTFGNHEFDWGQTVLAERTGEAQFPFLTANIVKNDTGACATAGWQLPAFADAPWTTINVGAAGNEAKLGVIAVTTQETPFITVASATDGLCFKDPTTSIIHYWDEMKAAGVDAIIVLSHLGYTDGGYGYGFPVYGDQTLAKNLAKAGKKPALIIGGHSHTDLAAATVVEGITVAQAHYAGRKVGRADLTIDKATGNVTVAWQRLVVDPKGPEDPDVKAQVAKWANDPWYQGEINRVVGYTNVDLVRDYNGDSMMGKFVNDAIYNDLNTDEKPENDVDVVFNNAGGLRADIVATTKPFTLTHGLLFNVLPFGNQTVVGTMTGAELMDILNQSATLFKGAIQVAGIQYKFYNYTDDKPGPQPWAWGAFGVKIFNKTSKQWEALEVNKTYKVATNEFLAPAGQDGFAGFKYFKNNTYWGDMLDGVERWVSKTYTVTNPYNETLDGRIARVGTAAGGAIVPVTILHHNDSHGRLVKTGNFQGLTQLATLVKQERAKNPNRTLLFSVGDNVQGDSTMFYFKDAGAGRTADGQTLPPNLWVNPFVAAMNAMGYNGMVLGNHEFNFGAAVFRSQFTRAAFPILGANVSDSGAYGINKTGIGQLGAAAGPGPQPVVNVYDGLEIGLDSGKAGDPITVGVMGITNHRVPQYELPSNIPGLTFTDPIEKAKELTPVLNGRTNAVVALTHIGFTEDPKSVEVDKNVDTNLAKQVGDIDVILGSHSHTNPTTGFGDYKFLPALIPGPTNIPVLVSQMYRYNTFLGQVSLGFMPLENGGFELVSRAGRAIAVAIDTPEDPAIKAIIEPYQTIINAYNNTEIGKTTVAIDTLNAFTEETNGANLQADASVWELERNGTQVDIHLSGAMTNRKIAEGATPENPYTLKVSDMFSAMPYENSLLVMRMNGPQLKAVLERAYRNYYFYKYVPGYGGYSYYTTCMLVTDKGNQITYRDTHPQMPTGNNVVSLKIGDKTVDFNDATKFYNVSTVNYLAAGSCNFNNQGKTLWPLDQIVADTQLYVRDAVIAYTKAQTGPLSPAVEGRLQFIKLMLDKKLWLPTLSGK
jgi:2',3'-cyclic-nucleotide 2'-phosphodiesterase (5'-nucleotidase family)